MTTAAEKVIQDALAQIEAKDREWVAMRDRVAADPRHQMLAAYSKSLDAPITRNGWEGHDQMIGQLMSSRHWRGKRAHALALVREGQVKVLPGFAKVWLRRAAEYRKTERMYQSTERRPMTLEAGTAAFCDMIAAPYRTPIVRGADLSATLEAAE